MPVGNDKFDAAANEAGCAMLIAAGAGATQVATVSLVSGAFVVGAGAAIIAGLSAYAYALNCAPWDPDAPPTHPGVNCNTTWEREGYADLYTYTYGSGLPSFPQAYNVTKILSVQKTGTTEWTTTYVSGEDGTTRTHVSPSVPEGESLCADLVGPGAPITPSPDPPPQIPDYTYTDPDDGCQITVHFEALALGPGDTVAPVFSMTPLLPAARAGGGIIGGCNFAPVIYYSPPGGGGGGGTIPLPPGGPGPDGRPPWVGPLIAALGGVVAGVVQKALDELFETPIPQWQYTMRAACNYKQDGTFEDYTITLPEAKYQERMLQLAETQLDFLQQHLLWKTPTCGGGGQSISGDPVTINWISDEVSPASGTRLNKIFTYFDQNNTTLADTVAHWKDFTWQSGPVMVSINGTEIGRSQVWASSVEEGKRVIEHAALVAGVDLTKGEWITSTSRSDRYGVQATMRVLSRDGVLGVTKRDGPNGYPEGIPG